MLEAYLDMNNEIINTKANRPVSNFHSSNLPTIVVIYGPPESGKTINRVALVKHYKCDHVFDSGFDDMQIEESKGRVMVLSHFPEIPDPRYRGRKRPALRPRIKPSLAVSVAEAKIAIGNEWVDPIPNYR